MENIFIIVGVARSGTTSLWHYLIQHPEIGGTKVKEPKFLSSSNIDFPLMGPGDKFVEEKIIKEENNYLKLFQSTIDYKIFGEASSDYFYYWKTSVPNIKKYFDNPKIIICLRNPVERSFSAFQSLVRDSRETLTFNEGLKMESERIKNGFDWMWHYKKGSLYYEGLRAFYSNFSRVKLIFFDDLKLRPKEILEECCEFLDVDKSFSFDIKTTYSSSGKPKNKLIEILTSRNNKITYNMREFLLSKIPRKYLEKIAKKVISKEQLDSDTKNKLNAFFAEDISSIEKFLSINLDHWK